MCLGRVKTGHTY
ncbi:hypothetical protein F383_16118 [Gossypium arboreum]|uniref:Uncharacterized protein n=1 Tax=Gossypium arboreum TaxID=29729 RepID=A0A0B0PX51_GOSAR|nr:hypothetical protein F383_28753 [Gossypium arboreum]KHG29029.1 hypothetical protein F383_16118 [Gossypium arboreum]